MIRTYTVYVYTTAQEEKRMRNFASLLYTTRQRQCPSSHANASTEHRWRDVRVRAVILVARVVATCTLTVAVTFFN